MIVSPNMNLPVPESQLEPGPDWATDIQNSLNIVDRHDHTPGNGVPISPSGININADLPFNNTNNITLLRSTRFTQTTTASIPAASPDLNALFVATTGELYFNDGNGNQVKITANGSVNSGAGSINGLTGTAAVNYLTIPKTFQFLSSTGVGANLDTASLIVRFPGFYPTITGTGIAIQSPSTLNFNYGLTLPQSPQNNVSERFLSITPGGVMNQTWEVDGVTVEIAGGHLLQVKSSGIDTAQIANNAITNGKILNATITEAKLVANTITAASIANATITTTQLSATAGILGSQLSSSAAITGTQLAAGANILGTQLSASANILGTQLTGLTVGTAQLAASSVTTAKVAANNITPPLVQTRVAVASTSSGPYSNSGAPGFTSTGITAAITTSASTLGSGGFGKLVWVGLVPDGDTTISACIGTENGGTPAISDFRITRNTLTLAQWRLEGTNQNPLKVPCGTIWFLDTAAAPSTAYTYEILTNNVQGGGAITTITNARLIVYEVL